MRRKLYLIAYDIADPRRLGRVAGYLCQRACRVQYSVFVIQLRQSELTGLLADLDDIIDPVQDDIRAYPLPAKGDVTLLGQQFFATKTLLMQKAGRSRLELIEDSAEDDNVLQWLQAKARAAID